MDDPVVVLTLMNPRHLEIFLAVCERGTFSGTATHIGVSEPAISRVIRGLEADFGTRLFERTGRGVRLTYAGEVCRERGQAVKAEIDRLHQEMQRLHTDRPGEISLSIPMRLGGAIVHRLTKEFTKRLPNAEIRINEGLQDDNRADLWEGKTDLAILCEARHPKGFYADRVGYEELVLVGHATRLGTGSGDITMHEATEHEFLLPGDNTPFTRFVFDSFARSGLSLNVVRKLFTVDALLAFTSENEGVTILPYSCVWREAREGSVTVRKIVEEPLRRDVYIASKGKATNPLMVTTVGILKELIDTTRDQTRWYA